jgi:hypothetical protein
MTVFKKKPKVRKYNDHLTASFVTHAAKIVARTLGRWIGKIIEVILG